MNQNMICSEKFGGDAGGKVVVVVLMVNIEQGQVMQFSKCEIMTRLTVSLEKANDLWD